MLYAVGKGFSLSFIDKESNFGVMHKQYAENKLFRRNITIYFLIGLVPESPKVTKIKLGKITLYLQIIKMFDNISSVSLKRLYLKYSFKGAVLQMLNS